jgi:hypothetical protein
VTSTSWIGLLALGAGHGVNPAMGWLFAVALGLQRESRGAVWASLMPLAVGHALAIATTISAAGLLGIVIPPDALRWGIAGLLVGLGVFRLIRSRHPRFGGMQVNGRELAVWSFLMATAHGAGLMVLPLVISEQASGHLAHHLSTAAILGVPGAEWTGLGLALVHTAGYLLVTGLLAVVVYERIGLRFLRKAWVNLDLIWSVALVLTGIATLVR